MTIFLFFTAFLMLIGLCFGSLSNSIIYRMPLKIYQDYEKSCIEFLTEQGYSINHSHNKHKDKKQNKPFDITAKRSHCPRCGHLIAWYENIPLIGFLFLKGKCRYCHEKIPLFYFLSELFGLAWAGFIAFYPLIPLSFIEANEFLGVGSWLFNAHFWALIAYFFAGWLLWMMFCIDAQHQLLPDELTHSFIGVSLMLHLICYFNLNLGHDLIDSKLPELHIGLLNGLILVSVFQLMYQLMKKFTGKESLGQGDFPLVFGLGLWLDWTQIPAFILISSGSALLLLLLRHIFYKINYRQPLAFGPSLILGGIITFYGINSHYAL